MAVQESNVSPKHLTSNLRHKAIMVAGGHTTKTPSYVTYSSVVLRYSVQIMLMIAALNDLDLQATYIKNAYLAASCCEKIWTRSGPEFGMY